MKFIDKYTIPTLLEYTFSKYSEENAYSFVGGRQNTYKDLQKDINKIEVLLKNLNIQKGDKVAILATNSPQWVASYLAIAALGAVVVPILPDFSKREITNILEHSESKAIFVSEKLQEKISQELSILTINIENQTLIGKENTNIKHSYDDFAYAKIEEEDLLAIIYTSGTTGFSKGVMLSHKNILWNIKQCKTTQKITYEDRFLSILPLSHTYENTVGMLSAFASGSATYYLDKLPTPNVLLPALEKIRPTMMLSVPLVIEKIYKSKILKQINSKKITKFLYKIRPFQKILNKIAGKKLYKLFGGKLHFFGIGGAKLDSIVERFLLDSNFPYAIGYGMTETAPLLAGAIGKNRKIGFTGEVVKFLDLRITKENPGDIIGEVQVKGENVMQGYYKEPHLNKEVFTKDGWLRTGDLGMFDKNGMLCIKGRSKTMILGASGENIFPEEIESLINKIDIVLESLVIKKGEKLVAMVHLNMEELEEKIKILHKDMLCLKDEAIQYTDDTKKFIEEKTQESLKEIKSIVNKELNKFSQIHQIVLQPVPFDKTPTQKIKRFLYT